MKNPKIKIYLLLTIVAILLTSIIISNPVPFNYDRKFSFRYFYSVTNHQDMYPVKIPVVDELKQDNNLDQNLRTFIIIDKVLEKNIGDIQAKINGNDVDLMKSDCMVNPYYCLVSIDNYLITGVENNISFFPDLYFLNDGKDTFFGISFQID